MATYGEVVEVRRLTPRMVRVVLGGDGLDDFVPTEWTDQYVNALFPPDDAPYTVPFDVDEARALAPELRPVGRRYTVRAWDGGARRLTLDVVTHGDVGRAGRWAARARPGDRLQFLGPSGGYAPDPEAGGHLMAGDESALPAIAASLERVAAGQPVVVVVVVDDEEHHVALESPGDLEVRWVHRADAAPDDRGQLLRAVAGCPLPPGPVQAFVHGEANEVRALRRHLLGERGIARERASISPYWRRDHTDEQWRQVKREWLADWERDVPAPAATDA
ncbi:MAG: siderophore-interacting protein [Microthrixaceae bacterium]|nr:siderophore-interacting protein [Microthrixaceae bacterium]